MLLGVRISNCHQNIFLDTPLVVVIGFGAKGNRNRVSRRLPDRTGDTKSIIFCSINYHNRYLTEFQIFVLGDANITIIFIYILARVFP